MLAVLVTSVAVLCAQAWAVLVAYPIVFYWYGDKPVVAYMAMVMNSLGENLLAVWAIYWTVPIALTGFLIWLWRWRRLKVDVHSPLDLGYFVESIKSVGPVDSALSSVPVGDYIFWVNLILSPKENQVRVESPVLNLWGTRIVGDLVMKDTNTGRILQATTQCWASFVIPKSLAVETGDAHISILANGQNVQGKSLSLSFPMSEKSS